MTFFAAVNPIHKLPANAVPSIFEVMQRFLCDEMLGRLGRWLRAAGYDTVIAKSGQPDRQLLEQALRESRTLLTRDRKLAEFRHADRCVEILTADTIEQQVWVLSQRHSINWLYAPFSRCLLCNAPLIAADPARLAEVPPFSRERVKQLFTCPGCGKLFWDGSHVRRMWAKLRSWQQ